MPKVTFIGAGSAVFARKLMTDILAVEGLDEGEFALCDLDAARLDLARRIAERLIALTGKRWRVTASTERRDVLAGSDFIVNSIEVAGLANVRHDYDIPLGYGVDQCIGDTIGPGGIFKALRTGPAWLAILRDAERLCPDAWVLNYTNPMSILTLAALTATRMRTVGLCHSVQNTSRELADYLGVPHGELEFTCGGINHNAWFTALRHDGEDLYPRLRARRRHGGLRARPRALRHDAPFRGLCDREQRALLRVRTLLSQAARPDRQILPRGLPGRERLLRQQLAPLAR